MADSIYLFGVPDLSKQGFQSPQDLTTYLRGGIFKSERGRFRYTQARNAGIIVLSREGKAFGHLLIKDRVRPDDRDREEYEKVKWVYRATASIAYERPVPLLEKLGIRVGQYGTSLTHVQFGQILADANRCDTFFDDTDFPTNSREDELLLQFIRRRLGQSEFRRSLMNRFGNKCIVSGCDVPEALEAAHIAPYSGLDSNDPANGLLLRADLHTLFDCDLIAIDPYSLELRISPKLKSSSYSELDGRILSALRNKDSVPNAAALKERWERFR